MMGLGWGGKNKDAIQKATRDVLAIQRSDGGRSDLPSMDSTALATGVALVALHAARLPVSDFAYQRGVQFLLNTQMEDGSWYVKTGAAGFQRYFDNGFPLRRRSMDFRRRHQLGDDGARAGIAGLEQIEQLHG